MTDFSDSDKTSDNLPAVQSEGDAAPVEPSVDATPKNSHGVGTLKISRDGYVQKVKVAFLPEGLAYWREVPAKPTKKKVPA